MRLIIQRVASAVVRIDYKIFVQIKQGLVVFVGFGKQDTEKKLNQISHRLIKLRVFEDDANKMNLALAEVGGEILLVPNFTLYGDLSQNRPSFLEALDFKQAKKLFEKFTTSLKLKYSEAKVKTGVFGALMKVELVNDGPVTLLLDA